MAEIGKNFGQSSMKIEWVLGLSMFW